MATEELDVDLAAREDLQKLGYAQEMSRSRGLLHILFMTLAIMAVRGSPLLSNETLPNCSTAYGLAAPIATSLVGGGPVVMVWGWLLVSAFTQTLALSLAEICSKYPTSAGAYYWCFRLASPKYKVLLSWINGWLTMVGVWTIALSVTFGTAQLIVAGVGIYRPDWVATPWETYVIFLGVTAVALVFCLFFNRYLPTIDILCACWTALGIIVILVCLSVKAAAGRRPISFALGGFDAAASGWTPGWSFFIGLLPRLGPSATVVTLLAGVYVLRYRDDMAEEVHDPSKILPRAIAWSVPIGAIWGVVFLLPIVFTLPDAATLLSVPSGQPIGVMFTLGDGI
ncbi:hypothetical protein EV401DRAFT_2081217 [Pisolithus croceorrhizus]|nr:hypothetical protein EV401DRAFT_2081217 [Pisolithus croceorrhizus]